MLSAFLLAPFCLAARAPRRRLLFAACCAPLLTASPVRAQEPQILCLDTGGHTGRVSGVAFYTDPAHPDDRRLLSTGRDKSVRLWRQDADQGALKTFRYNSDANIKGEIVSSAFDPATRRLALGMRAGGDKEATEILIVDVLSPQGRLVRPPLKELKDSIVALAFSPDGKWLAACDSTGKGLVYDTAQWKSSKFTGNEAEAKGASQSSGVDSQVQSLAFSPDSSQLAYVHRETIEFKSLAGKKHYSKISLSEPNSLLCVAWAKNNTLAAADFQRVYRWANPENGANPDKLPLNSNALCLAFDREGRNLAIGTDSRPEASAQVAIWPQDRADAIQAKVNAPVSAIAFSEQGNFIASGSGAGELQLWKLEAGRPVQDSKRLAGIGKPVYHLAWSEDSDKVAWKQQQDAEDYALAFDLRRMASTSAQNASGLSESPLMQRTKEGDLETGAGASGAKLTVGKFVISQPGKEDVTLPFGVGIYDKNHARVYAAVDAEPGYVLEYDTSDAAHPRPLRRFAGYAGIPLSLCASPDGRYLAMGTTDQTIRLWSLKDEAGQGGANAALTQTRAPLICLFMGNTQQWAAWNPQTGFYYASVLGDDIICYQFNTSDNAQCADVVPVSTCSKPFSSPQCMAELFAQASVAPAKSRMPSERTLYQQIARRPVIDVARLQVQSAIAGDKVEFTPDDRDVWRTTSDAVILNKPLLAGDAPGVTWEFLNVSTGRRSIVARESAAPASHPNTTAGQEDAAQQTGRVRLTKGINTIRVVARSGDVSSVPQYIRVEKTGGEDKKGVLHIMAIGVSQYKDPMIRLDYADADARAIANQFAMQNPGLYEKIEAPVVLTNEGATRDSIKAALENIKMGEDDTLVFFIAGHGMPGNNNTQENSEFYFAPYDVDKDKPESTGLGWKYLLTQLAGLNAKHSFLFIDHCFAGGISSILQNDAKQGQNKRRATDEAVKSLNAQNFITFMASGPDEASNESVVWKHGAFTYALLNVLKGVGFTASSDNGAVSVRDLDNQLGIAMKKALKMLDGSAKGTQQTPGVYAPFTSEIRDLPVIKYQ